MSTLARSLLVAIITVAVGGAAAAQSDTDAGLSSDGVLPVGSVVLGETAQVVDVVDGATISVDRGNGVETVRYIGIEAPGDPHGSQATAVNEALVGDRWVILESDTTDTDADGRLLRYVWLPTADGLLLANNELVRRGLAESRAEPPDTWYQDLLDQTQAEAMANGVGRYAVDSTPGPTTDPTAEPTPRPTPAGVDRTLKAYDETIKYRWLDASEYECRNEFGCWGLLLKPATACTKNLRVQVVMRGDDRQPVGVVWKTRKNVKRNESVRFRIDAPEGGARTAAIAKVRCTQR